MKLFCLVLIAPFLLLAACSSLPTIKVDKHSFPKAAYVGEPGRPYEALGAVRTKVDFPSLNPDWEEGALCKNYYNKAVADLVKRAKDQGGEAVIRVKSVVFMVDGRSELYDTPECADDGQEGQVLAQGIAVKWQDPDDSVGAPAAAAKKKKARMKSDQAEKAQFEAAPSSEEKRETRTTTSKVPNPGDPAVIRGN